MSDLVFIVVICFRQSNVGLVKQFLVGSYLINVLVTYQSCLVVVFVVVEGDGSIGGHLTKQTYLIVLYLFVSQFCFVKMGLMRIILY